MNIINISKNTELLFLTDIHAHKYQFFEALKKYPPNNNRILCACGDYLDKGFLETEKEDEEEICNKLMELQNDSLCFAIKGNHEIKRSKKIKDNTNTQVNWIRTLPLCLRFSFESGKRITVIHAGITPLMTENDLDKNIETCYVRDIDPETNKMIPLKWVDIDGVKTLVKEKPGVLWHELYDGRFGFVISGHDANRQFGEARYYNYSCNLDSAVYSSGNLSILIIDGFGNIKTKDVIHGPASNPELNIKY